MEAKGTDLAIQSVKFHNYVAGIAEVWTRPGTHSGFASSSSGWTMVATSTTTVGSWTMQEIILDTAVIVPAGMKQAFYVTQEVGTNLIYTPGTSITNVAFQDDYMKIYEGPPKIYPFGGQNGPAIFNGEFGYLVKSSNIVTTTSAPTTGSPTPSPTKNPTKLPTRKSSS